MYEPCFLIFLPLIVSPLKIYDFTKIIIFVPKSCLSLKMFLISWAFPFLSLSCFLDFLLFLLILQPNFLRKRFLIKKNTCSSNSSIHLENLLCLGWHILGPSCITRLARHRPLCSFAEFVDFLIFLIIVIYVTGKVSYWQTSSCRRKWSSRRWLLLFGRRGRRGRWWKWP